MPPGETGILQMDADAPRPNGDFAKMNAWQANFVSQTQALRTNEAVPATDRNVALRNQLLKLEREKKKTTLCKPHLVLKGQSADGVRSRRGQFKRITALAEAVWDSIAVVSLWICIGFHLHCVQPGSHNCLAFH